MSLQYLFTNPDDYIQKMDVNTFNAISSNNTTIAVAGDGSSIDVVTGGGTATVSILNPITSGLTLSSSLDVTGMFTYNGFVLEDPTGSSNNSVLTLNGANLEWTVPTAYSLSASEFGTGQDIIATNNAGLVDLNLDTTLNYTFTGTLDCEDISCNVGTALTCDSFVVRDGVNTINWPSATSAYTIGNGAVPTLVNCANNICQVAWQSPTNSITLSGNATLTSVNDTWGISYEFTQTGSLKVLKLDIPPITPSGTDAVFIWSSVPAQILPSDNLVLPLVCMTAGAVQYFASFSFTPGSSQLWINKLSAGSLTGTNFTMGVTHTFQLEAIQSGPSAVFFATKPIFQYI